jgi:hypothetical protein
MKKMMFLPILLVAAMACKRQLSREETEKELKMAMYRSITTSPGFDSTKENVEVKTVTFYEDQKVYQCEFTVHMHLLTGHDTTGIMTAVITKDFSKVRRRS